LLLHVGNLLPRRIECMGSLIVLRLRRDAGCDETGLPIVLLLRVGLTSRAARSSTCRCR